MAGKKGRSGRLPKDLIFHSKLLLAQCVRITETLLRDDSIPKAKKLEVASKFALRTIPDRLITETRQSLSHDDRQLLVDRLRELIEPKRATIIDSDKDQSPTIGNDNSQDK